MLVQQAKHASSSAGVIALVAESSRVPTEVDFCSLQLSTKSVNKTKPSLALLHLPPLNFIHHPNEDVYQMYSNLCVHVAASYWTKLQECSQQTCLIYLWYM